MSFVTFPIIALLLCVGALSAADGEVGNVMNPPRSGIKTIAGIIIETKTSAYYADITERGCLLRKIMVKEQGGYTANGVVEGIVVHASDGSAITWGVVLERNAEVRLLMGPVVTVWMNPVYGKDGKLLQPGGWMPSVAKPAAGKPAQK